MAKVLYSQSTQSISSYPRLDDEPVQGLDPDYLVLLKVGTTPPSYDPVTEMLVETWAVDLPSLEYRQGWTVDPLPPVEDWATFRTTIIPPEGVSSFEVWLSQAKSSYQSAIVAAAMASDADELQRLYDLLKPILPTAPTPEELTEWQAAADAYAIPVTF